MDEFLLGLVEDIKTLDTDEVLQKWGGVSIQFPSFRGAVRQRIIIKEYEKLAEHLSEKNKYLILGVRFNVSTKLIRKIISTHKKQNVDHNDHSDHNLE